MSSTILKFKTIKNIRDLGGIPTKNGKKFKSHLLLRSADLTHLSNEEYEKLLNEYNLKMVIDFRSSHSYPKNKDLIDERVIYKHYYAIPFLNTHQLTLDCPIDYDEFFKIVYSSFVLENGAKDAYLNFFHDILSLKDDECLLFHCTSGKDRTGIATILLMSICGCSKEEMYKEHDKTNIEAEIDYENYIKNNSPLSEKELYFHNVRYIAKKEYLDHFFKVVDEYYGDLDSFIRYGIGLTNEEIEQIRHKFLENDS